MGELYSWAGKVEDIALTYEVELSKHPLLPAPTGEANVTSTSKYEVEKDIVEIDWDHSVTKADKIDYEIAVCCGVLTGLIDILFVGPLSIDKANEWGKEHIEKFVISLAKRDKDFKATTQDHQELLKAAISFLEKNHGMAADTLKDPFGGGLQHHFRDFSHHFSIGGLACSLITQFSDGKIVIGADTEGNLLIKSLEDTTLIGKNVHEKITYGVIEWFYHMASDMAGSSSNPGGGTGIPGPILSFIKRLSILPVFKDKKIGEIEFRTYLSKLFNGTLLADHDEAGKIIKGTQRRFDLRTEIGLINQIGLQALPVAINECLVRSTYFIRRLYIEIKDIEISSPKDLLKIDPKAVLPLNNSVVLRMLTVATGTFSAVDFADAGIRALVKHKGNIHDPGFWVDFAVRVNFVGIGRFVIACGMDAHAVIEQSQKEKARKSATVEQFEKDLIKWNSLTLTFDQAIVLLSMKKLIIEYDIAQTKKEKAKKYKEEWLKIWKENELKLLPVIKGEDEIFFYKRSELNKLIISELESSDDIHWLFLVTLESMMFEPYCRMGVSIDEKFDDLELESDFLRDVFINEQPIITIGILESYRKAIEHYKKVLTGQSQQKTIKAIGTAGVAVIVGGIALFAAPALAPAIASALFGEAVAGLSGAALTSASLAILGGGSLAAGGLGMAGGTAVITGGGALIGAISGSGLSVLSSVAFLSDEDYVLKECTKLLTYCKEVLIDLYNDIKDVELMYGEITTKLADIKDRIEEFKNKEYTDNETKRQQKKLLAVCKRSIKYLERTEDTLHKIVEKKEKALAEKAHGSKSVNVNLLKETEAIMEKGWYRVKGKPIELKLTPKKYKMAMYLNPEEVHDLADSISRMTLSNDTTKCKYNVINGDSFDVAIEMMNSEEFNNDPNAKVLVLNFANPVSPGGGVRHGAKAQEEDLCRRSTLLASLEGRQAAAYYKYHKKLNSLISSDAVILSPYVEIIKDSNNNLLKDSAVVSVITCAAPIHKASENNKKEDLEKIFYRRIKGILQVAATHDYRYLVLGAFGCGAFGNDVAMVARQFFKVLKGIKSDSGNDKEFFKEIAFAVKDDSESLYKLRAFGRFFDDFYKSE